MEQNRNKQQSRIVSLSVLDLDQIMDLENEVCSDLIRANKEKIKKRLDLGNVMMGCKNTEGKLIASVGFRYGFFNPDDFKLFPTTFTNFSDPDPNFVKPNAGFIYSMNVLKEYRTLAVSKNGLKPKFIPGLILDAVLSRMKQEGLTYLLGDGRPAFFNGSKEDIEFEAYEEDPVLRDILSRYSSGLNIPTEEEKVKLMEFPVFKSYNKLLGGGLKISWIIAHFFPEDIPTGGYRVILYKQI
jgi:hypothetical protein